jgi:general secretion pathway protein G
MNYSRADSPAVEEVVVMNLRKKLSLRAARKGQKGMTLIEIMVVIAIIGIVMSAVGYGVMNYLAEAKVDAARVSAEKLASVLEMYYARHDEYPAQLTELTKKTGKRKKSALKNSDLKDPWKKKWIYSVDGDSFKLCSSGPDKKQGTDDDICAGEEADEAE